MGNYAIVLSVLEKIQGPGMVVKDGRDGFSEKLMLKLKPEQFEGKCFKDYIAAVTWAAPPKVAWSELWPSPPASPAAAQASLSRSR